MNIRYFISRIVLAGAIILAAGISQAQDPPEGGSRASATHDFVDLIGPGDGSGISSITDYVLFPYGPVTTGGFGIGNRANTGVLSKTPFRIRVPAPENALLIGQRGIALGAAASSSEPTATFYVRGGAGLGFPAADVLIEDLNTTSVVRNLMTMKNSGGVSCRWEDTLTGTKFSIDNKAARFEVNNYSGPAPIVPFSVSSAAEPNAPTVSPSGVSAGRQTAGSTLEAYANGTPSAFNPAVILDSSTITSMVESPAIVRDRTMLNLVNRGGAFMTFTDTSRGSTWFFSNSNDELFMKKSGVGSPGLRILATGEFRFVNANQSQFAILPNGNITARGVLLHSSDRNLKENIQNVDPQEVLGKLVDLPISTWNYIHDEDNTPHMGPMAQDFYATFGLGVDDKTIAEIDKSGIAIAAIQGLNAKVDAKDQKIAEQAEAIAELTERLDRLEAMLSAQNPK